MADGSTYRSSLDPGPTGREGDQGKRTPEKNKEKTKTIPEKDGLNPVNLLLDYRFLLIFVISLRHNLVLSGKSVV